MATREIILILTQLVHLSSRGTKIQYTGNKWTLNSPILTSGEKAPFFVAHTVLENG